MAAILAGPERELVRQVRVGIKASKLLQPYGLEFPPYHPVPGEALILQFWVSTERSNHVIFGASEPRDGIAGPTINLNPTDQGPLAYETIWRGDGWRAALEGSWPDALRLAGGIVAAVMAVMLRPAMARARSKAVRITRASGLALVKPIFRSLRQARSFTATRGRHAHAQSAKRTLYVFPWLISGFALLHYIANNLVLIRAYESVMLAVVIMAGVAVLFVALRPILKSSASAAVFVGLLGIGFFSYGHIYSETEPADDRFLLGLGVPIILGAGTFLRQRSDIAQRLGRMMNFGSIVLIILPISQIAFVILSGQFRLNQDSDSLKQFPGLAERIGEAKARIAPDDLPDIYYFILDEYPRNGSPESFDNSVFVQALESRGFYVDPHARSNYTFSAWSISSMLNMRYTDEYIAYGKSQDKLYQIYNAAVDHNLGRIMKALDYYYIHVSSGWYITESNPRADVVASFGPNGRILSGATAEDPCIKERILTLENRFVDGFLETTAFLRFWSSDPRRARHFCTYHWSQPEHSVAWLEFIKDTPDIGGPKFVFGHLIRPHGPYSFDQHGNTAPVPQGWDDDHDPTVQAAFYGQVIWLNGRILEVVDAILAKYDEPPIIVIMGDHGYERADDSPFANDILGAYLLPGGRADVLYPWMTSVNAFRVILNGYFDLDLEILEDRVRHP